MKLLGVERYGRTQDRYYLHPGDDGRDKITVQTVEDVEPVLEANKRAFNDAPERFGRDSFHKVASIPAVVISETSRVLAQKWGCQPREAYSEFMRAKTDRAQKAWRYLLNAREFRYFRTRPGRV